VSFRRGWISSLATVVSLASLGCSPSPPAAPPRPPPPGAVTAPSPLVYRIEATEKAEDLRITATVPAGLAGSFGTDELSARYVDNVQIDGRAASFVNGVVQDEHCVEAGCTLTFGYHLAAAARSMREPDYAMAGRGVFIAAPSTFLLRPLEGRSGAPAGKFRLHVRGTTFVASLPPVPGEPDGVEGDLADLPATGYVGFGDLHVEHIPVGGSDVAVAIDAGAGVERRAALVAWVKRQATAVAKRYTAFPVPRAAVFLTTVRGRDVMFGKTLGHGAASIVVMVGNRATEASLKRDWVLTHEMVHLALPAMPLEQRWFEEGIATYVEPGLRAEAGQISAAEAWYGAVNGMPNGLPEPGDRGLDHTDTWGRRYWGGALFCLEADLALRRATDNRLGLPDALRAIRERHGGIGTRSDVGTVLASADRSLGVDVLAKLYDQWKAQPVPVDLERTFARLGVVREGDHVVLRDDAPEADLRRAMIQAESPPGTLGGRSTPMEKTSTGLQFEDTVVGSGASPTRGQTCQMHYTGWLWVDGAKGAKFDSSHDRGKPFSFRIGVGQVIAGWDEGVSTMKVGGKRTLLIPAELGYGPRGAGGVIPPNATLLFEVELLGLQLAAHGSQRATQPTERPLGTSPHVRSPGGCGSLTKTSEFTK
jgi:FKBP-type peptidyl-prolyl cis-trans isomerase